ncbi:MAG: 50S ribosomal protein L24 [Elusimicrobia bacterium]|nr:50S ribosomal protein L24 [Elusimicrobiota bacterium]
MWLKKKEKVIVLSGKDKGKRGEVLKSPGEGLFIVSKINVAKRHERARSAEKVGGIIEKEMPLHQSKLMLICPQCDAPTRSKKEVLGSGDKVRICKNCSERIE